MTERQSALLDLVREIDAFCTEHGITYYCAAGTVLGAVRHGGFIPWDDDIDLIMKRDEFEKFVSAFSKYGRSDRKIEFYEGNHEHHSTVARYVREDTSMFCHYHITGHAAAGILIDIFILDPIPDGHEAQMDYLAKFYAYADLIAPTLSYSNRLPDRYSHVFGSCEARVRELAEETTCGSGSCVPGSPEYEAAANAAAEELSQELFSYREEDCGYCMYRWGSMPFIYPKEFFGEPARMQFEDMIIPVPAQWASYLAVNFGSRWCDIPYVEGQAQHTSVFSDAVDYHELYEMRDAEHSQDELIRIHREMQAARRKSDAIARKLEEYAADLQIRLCRAEMMSIREEAEACSNAENAALGLFRAGRYTELLEIYKPYIDMQTSMPFMGARKHGAYYHWQFPVVIPVDERVLGCILMSLIFTDRMPAAEKITGIYERAGIESAAVREAGDIIRRTGEAAGAYYTGDYEGALEIIRGIKTDGHLGSPTDRIPALTELYWLASARTGLDAEKEKQLRQLASSHTASDGIRKAWADHLWETGRRDEASEIYIDIMRMSRNGMFRKDILDKGVAVDPLPPQKPAAFRDNSVTALRRQLLEEAADICDRAGIPYILGERLTALIESGNDIGHDENDAELLMTADSARRFIEAFSSTACPDTEDSSDISRTAARRLMYWGDGDAVGSFALKYAAVDSMVCDLRGASMPEDDGSSVGIMIRILHSDSPGGLRRKYIRAAELMGRALDAEGGSGIHRRSGGLKNAAADHIKRMPQQSKDKWRRRIFRMLLDKEVNAEGKDYWYYSGGSAGSPRRSSVPASAFDRISGIGLDGHIYKAAAAFTENGAQVTGSNANSIFVLQSGTVAAGDLITEEDIRKYRELPWSKYRKASKTTAACDRKVRDVWISMRDAAIAKCSDADPVYSTENKDKTLC